MLSLQRPQKPPQTSEGWLSDAGLHAESLEFATFRFPIEPVKAFQLSLRFKLQRLLTLQAAHCTSRSRQRTPPHAASVLNRDVAPLHRHVGCAARDLALLLQRIQLFRQLVLSCCREAACGRVVSTRAVHDCGPSPCTPAAAAAPHCACVCSRRACARPMPCHHTTPPSLPTADSGIYCTPTPPDSDASPRPAHRRSLPHTPRPRRRPTPTLVLAATPLLLVWHGVARGGRAHIVQRGRLRHRGVPAEAHLPRLGCSARSGLRVVPVRLQNVGQGEGGSVNLLILLRCG